MKPLPLAVFTLLISKEKERFRTNFLKKKKVNVEGEIKDVDFKWKAFVPERRVLLNPRKQERTWITALITETML